MEDQLLLVVGIIALALVLVLVIVVLHLHRRVSRLTQGSSGSLEDTLHDLLTLTHELRHEVGRAKKHRTRLDEALANTLQTPPTLRFNPFREAGSNQSFATALVTSRGDGVILSSMYAQGKTSIFAKPVKAFVSKYELTAEEAHVLQQAKNQVL